MIKEYVLVKFEDNWADEMNISGWRTYLKEDWDKYVESVPSDSFPCTKYVGTNEEIEYENRKEYFNKFKVVPITEEECRTLNKLFNGEQGFFLTIEEYDSSGAD